MVNHGDVFKLTIFLSSQWWQRQQVVCVERCGEHSDANVRKPAIVKNVVTIHDNRYTEHLAAVKAIAWSPHHHGLLASGGGTADRYIRFSSHELQLLFDRHHFTQVLEHFDGSTHAISRHWQPGKQVLSPLPCHAAPTPGLQPGLVETCKRTGVHARLQSEPDSCLEIPQSCSGDKSCHMFNLWINKDRGSYHYQTYDSCYFTHSSCSCRIISF